MGGVLLFFEKKSNQKKLSEKLNLLKFLVKFFSKNLRVLRAEP